MSLSYPPIVMALRTEATRSNKRPEYFVGTTANVWMESLDALTKRPVDYAGAAILTYRMPRLGGYETRVYGVQAERLSPRLWLAKVPLIMVGTYEVWGALADMPRPAEGPGGQTILNMQVGRLLLDVYGG